ncbi:hypothetical protein BGZ83_002944, partial [Gryganskiella cystojenkinii]
MDSKNFQVNTKVPSNSSINNNRDWPGSDDAAATDIARAAGSSLDRLYNRGDCSESPSMQHLLDCAAERASGTSSNPITVSADSNTSGRGRGDDCGGTGGSERPSVIPETALICNYTC